MIIIMHDSDSEFDIGNCISGDTAALPYSSRSKALNSAKVHYSFFLKFQNQPWQSENVEASC